MEEQESGKGGRGEERVLNLNPFHPPSPCLAEKGEREKKRRRREIAELRESPVSTHSSLLSPLRSLCRGFVPVSRIAIKRRFSLAIEKVDF